MPLEYVLVHVARLVSTVTPTFGLTKPVETEIAGSPFLARVYRVSQTTVQRDEDQPGTATLDQMQRISVLDPLCPIQINDIAFLPRADGSYTRAKVIRIRPYADRIQYDLETGAEGVGLPENLPMLSSTEQQALQAQIDALVQQIGDLQMSFKNAPIYTGKFPIVPLTATTTITKQASSTTYQCNSATAIVVTLPASTGDNTEYEFVNLGVGVVTFAYVASPTQTGPTLANISLAQHDAVAFKEAGANDWEGAGG